MGNKTYYEFNIFMEMFLAFLLAKNPHAYFRDIQIK